MRKASKLSTKSDTGRQLAEQDVGYFEGISSEAALLREWTPKAIADFYASAFDDENVVVILVDDQYVHRVVASPEDLGETAKDMSRVHAVMAMSSHHWAMLRMELPLQSVAQAPQRTAAGSRLH